MLRNVNPDKTLQLLSKFEEECSQEAETFQKINDMLMIAMCYKSLKKYEDSETVISTACELAEKILEVRGISYEDLINSYEQMIYMTVYCRLAQRINEKAKRDIDSVSFLEIKINICILDYFINCVILASQKGYGYFDFIRLDMMTTVTLLRNTVAVKLDICRKRRIQFSAGTVKTIEEYKEEAIQAVNIIETAYQRLDEAGVSYNKIDGMYNQMNCSCVCAGFGEYEKAIRMLDRIINFYSPDNSQEVMVYDLLQKKLAEIKRRMYI